MGRGGADAGGEVKGKDEEDSGYGADCTENAGAFEAAEKSTDDCAGQGGYAGNQVLNLCTESPHEGSEESSRGAGYYANDGYGGGGTGNFNRATKDEPENRADGSPGDGASNSPQQETSGQQ